jgi:hypothetical protein
MEVPAFSSVEFSLTTTGPVGRLVLQVSGGDGEFNSLTISSVFGNDGTQTFTFPEDFDTYDPSLLIPGTTLQFQQWFSFVDSTVSQMGLTLSWTSPSVSSSSSSSTGASSSGQPALSSAGSTSPPGGSSGLAGISGDPQFVGLLGQRFQVHGVDGQVYSIIRDRDLTVNARFTFLADGRCPKSGEVATSTACWTHPGSYLGAVGIVAANGDSLLISSGGWDAGFTSVLLNGAQLQPGHNFSSAALRGSLSRFSVVVIAGNFELQIDNSDRFVNIVTVTVRDWAALSSHGLLGQTWKEHHSGRQVKEVEGEVDDYAELDNDLLGQRFGFPQLL